MSKVLPRKHRKYNLLVYYALCGMMTNWLEENVIPDKMLNKQKVKMLTKQLHLELLKPVDEFYKKLKEDGYEDGVYDNENLTDLFHIATIAMEHYFRLSLQIEDMDEIRKQGLVTQLNILLKSYDLETLDVPTY
jgi:hypothetical protein